MNRSPLLCLLALLLSLSVAPFAHADGEEIGLPEAVYEVQQPGSSSSLPVPQAINDGPRYDYGPTCGLGGLATCYEGSPCIADELEGVLYDVFLAGEKVGEVCVTPQQAAEQQQVTPGLVLRAFRRLTWPQSDLTIQPPGGTTLVNFATNFYTDNTGPARQSITLLGQDVLIEATPATYTWLHGDGTTQATDVPGRPYPGLDITHDYQSVGTFAPRLDTTYTGRYRLNGEPWIAIPETLTVAGTPQTLQSVEARPTLVNY